MIGGWPWPARASKRPRPVSVPRVSEVTRLDGLHARAVKAHTDRMSGTSPYLLVLPGEGLDAKGWEAELRRHLPGTGGVMLGVFAGDPTDPATPIIATAGLTPGRFVKVSHVVTMGVGVEPGYRGQGIGSRLIDALVEWGRAEPRVRKIELSVMASNETAVAIYRDRGFTEEGIRARKFQRPEGGYDDEILMALDVENRNHKRNQSRN